MPISVPPTFSSVRSSFAGAGMGIASNLYAYRRGGGIVPSDSYYGAIGTGNPGDPVRLSQFAGIEPSAISNIVNESAGVYYSNSSGYPSSALTRLTVSTSGKMFMLGSTTWNPAADASGSILINGTEYWNPSQSGSTSGEINSQNWLLGGGPAQFACRAVIDTTVSGTPNGYTTYRYGVYDTWQTLSEDRAFSIVCYANTSNRTAALNTAFFLQFARVSDLNTILKSCTISFFVSSSTFGNYSVGGGGQIQ